jgi:hypothetical protein
MLILVLRGSRIFTSAPRTAHVSRSRHPAASAALPCWSAATCPGLFHKGLDVVEIENQKMLLNPNGDFDLMR